MWCLISEHMDQFYVKRSLVLADNLGCAVIDISRSVRHKRVSAAFFHLRTETWHYVRNTRRRVGLRLPAAGAPNVLKSTGAEPMKLHWLVSGRNVMSCSVRSNKDVKIWIVLSAYSTETSSLTRGWVYLMNRLHFAFTKCVYLTYSMLLHMENGAIIFLRWCEAAQGIRICNHRVPEANCCVSSCPASKVFSSVIAYQLCDWYN